jgi:tetratricopeptide (TPR) repeat protein
MSPDMTTINLGLGWISLLQGRLEEALALIQREKLAGYRCCGLAMVYHAMGRHSESDQKLAELIEQGECWAFQIAAVYGYRGEVDKAFEWLERMIEVRDSGAPLTKGALFLASLHSDPRWPALLRKIGF